MRKTIVLSLLLFTGLFKGFSQEKQEFLMGRYSMVVELIDKNYSSQQLDSLSNKFKKTGLQMTYSSLEYNSKKEITSIYLYISSTRGSASMELKGKQPIPRIYIGTDNDIPVVGPLSKDLEEELTPL